MAADDAASCHKSQAAQAQQLFARIQQDIEDEKPRNVIHFVVDFLCKHYPEHLQGFAAIWNADPELERERLCVAEFFKAQKLPTEIAAHFTNAGFDTLETLCTLTPESLDDIEKFNQTRWLPGHKVRLQQTFSDIAGRIRAFSDEKEQLIRAAKANVYCQHPHLIGKPGIPAPHALPAGSLSGVSHGCYVLSPRCAVGPCAYAPVKTYTNAAYKLAGGSP